MPETQIKVQESELQKMLKGILSRLGNIKPAAELMGQIGMESIQTNFEEGGRPTRWKPLADATIRQRKKQDKRPGRT